MAATWGPRSEPRLVPSTPRGPLPDDPTQSLAADLRNRDEDALLRLLQQRPDLATPAPGRISDLVARAAGRASVALALESLDSAARSVLEAATLAGDPVHPEAVCRLLGEPIEFVAPLLDQLVDMALLWGRADDRHVLAAVPTLLGPFVAGLGPPAAAVLPGLGRAQLRVIAEHLGLPSQATATVAEVSEALGQDFRVRRAIEQVGAAGEAVLTRLAAGSPLGRHDGVSVPAGPKQAQTTVQRLMAHGLLLPYQESTVVLPAEVGIVLRGGRVRPPDRLHPPVPKTAVPTAAERARRSAAGSAAEVVRMVETLLRRCAQAPLSLLRTGGVGARDLRRMAAELHVTEDQAVVLLHLGAAAGLLGRSAEEWLPTSSYPVWRRSTVAERWAALVEGWRSDDHRVGPSAPGGPRASAEPGAGSRTLLPPLDPRRRSPGMPELREWLLAHLAAHDDAEVDAEWLVASDAWYHPARTGEIRAQTVRTELSVLESLGLVAFGNVSPWTTPLSTGSLKTAAAALAEHLPPPVTQVILQPDLTAVAPGPLDALVEDDLRAVADAESSGGATVFRFSAASLRPALDRGVGAEDILRTLRERSSTPVPQALEYLVRDTARRHGALRVGVAGTVVRSEDAVLLTSLMADARAASLELRQLADSVLVSPLPADVVLAGIRRLGHDAAAEGGAAELPARRASAAPRPLPRKSAPAPSHEQLQRLARTMHAAERRHEQRLGVDAGAPTSSREILERARAAAAAGSSLWIRYVDESGRSSERLVDPITIEPGRVVAYDHRLARVRPFVLHRISSASAPA